LAEQNFNKKIMLLVYDFIISRGQTASAAPPSMLPSLLVTFCVTSMLSSSCSLALPHQVKITGIVSQESCPLKIQWCIICPAIYADQLCKYIYCFI
jgi:hypothetical protein